MEKKQRTLNNKGFSLIELIVVIAIMAILVGALAPQVTKYIESARRASDVQALGALFTVVQTTMIEADTSDTIESPASGTYQITGDGAVELGNASFATAVRSGLTGNNYPTLSSAALKDQPITVTISNTGSIEVKVDAKAGTKDVTGVTITESGSKWTAAKTETE